MKKGKLVSKSEDVRLRPLPMLPVNAVETADYRRPLDAADAISSGAFPFTVLTPACRR